MRDHRFILVLMCMSLLALPPLEKHHIRNAGLETRTGKQTAVTAGGWSDWPVTKARNVGPVANLDFLSERPHLHSVHGGLFYGVTVQKCGGWVFFGREKTISG